MWLLKNVLDMFPFLIRQKIRQLSWNVDFFLRLLRYGFFSMFTALMLFISLVLTSYSWYWPEDWRLQHSQGIYSFTKQEHKQPALSHDRGPVPSVAWWGCLFRSVSQGELWEWSFADFIGFKLGLQGRLI